MRTAKRVKKAAALAAALCLLLGGCKDKTPDGSSQSDSPRTEKIPEIVMTFQTLSGQSVLTDFDEVMDAINEIAVKEAGVRVKARLVDAQEAFTEYSLWISNREQVDLMILNYQDITAYVNRGMVLPLDELLAKEGKGILALHDETCRPTEGSVVDGQTYGVAPVYGYPGSGGGIWLPRRYLAEAGIPFEEEKVYTMDELTAVFGKLKQMYPEKYPLGQITSAVTSSTASYYMRAGDSLGGDMVSGIVNEKTMQVENFYASAAYRNFLEHLRVWYEAGYIYPDAAFTDLTQAELLQAKVIMSYPLASVPSFTPERWIGEPCVCLRTAVPMTGAQYAKSGFWVIPSTSREPEAAMRFLDLMFADTRIGNLLSNGIEGKHYVVTDEENRLIDFPEGIDSSSTGFDNPLGLYGNYKKQYQRTTLEELEKTRRYSEEAMKHRSGVQGIAYSTSNVSRQMAELQEVAASYIPILESGSVDLEIYYPEFLRELEKAGIGEVIADKQQQLDEWLAEQNTK